MDVEDRRRYFIVGSVILEIVQPLFRTKLENDYSSKGLGSLQAFLNTLPVIHILFHLRHRNANCCKDKINCRNNSKLPLIYCQWDLLYTENPGQRGHNCHCKFTAKPVQLNELDITLACLILLNCCHLGPSDENAVHKLRHYKNDYLSHNVDCKIDETEYKSLWTDLTNFVLQLDPNKQDDLIRIEKRPLDEGLCSRYSTDLLNVHKKLNEIHTDIQEILEYQRNKAICQYCKTKLIEQGMDKSIIHPYKLGQDIFYLHDQIDLNSTLIQDVVMMDDGRLVMCLFNQFRLLICNADESEIAIIQIDRLGIPCSITAVNNSTVAVIVYQNFAYIAIYDINNGDKLKSIPLSRNVRYRDINMKNNKLIIGTDRALVIIDYQTGEIVQEVETNCEPCGIHFSGNRLFYRDSNDSKNNLQWYSLTDENIHTLILPSIVQSMTTLQDGSIYVLCEDASVQHVSSDGIHFQTLEANESNGFSDCEKIQYNSKQKKMVTLNKEAGIVKILHEV